MENFTGEKVSELNNVMKIIIGGVVGYLIFTSIIIYGDMIMRSAIGEKTNRIVETITSSVKSSQLMLGKIISTSLVGITQFVIWLIIDEVLFALAPSLLQADTPMATQAVTVTESHSEISNIIVALYYFPLLGTSGAFLLFFVGGYLLYSSLYATVGAMVDNETDTQQSLMPILIPLMSAFYVGMSSVIEEPHDTISTVFSYIPFTSPVVMLMHILFGVAWQEVLIPLLLLYTTFFLVIETVSKIYHIGILMYDKKPTHKEVWKRLKIN